MNGESGKLKAESRLPEKLRVDFDIVGPDALEARPFRLRFGFTTAAGMTAEFRVESLEDPSAGIEEVVRCAFAAMRIIDLAQARQAMDAIATRLNELEKERSK